MADTSNGGPLDTAGISVQNAVESGKKTELMNLESESYVNPCQKRAVEFLHRRKKATAVEACSNSNIQVYLTRDGLSDKYPELGPYEIDMVVPLPDSEYFETKVTLTADWTEVDQDE